MRRVAVIGMLSTLLAVAACTPQGRYQAAQDLGRQQAGCDKLPTAQEAQACREAYSQSYEDYQREREALLNDD